MRPARRRGRGSKLSLPPTLDSKRAAQLKAEQLANETSKRLGEDQDRNNGNMHGDDDRARDFVPEHMPNITRWKDLPPEPWNDQQLGLSALSPPESQVIVVTGLTYQFLKICRRRHLNHWNFCLQHTRDVMTTLIVYSRLSISHVTASANGEFTLDFAVLVCGRLKCCLRLFAHSVTI